MALLLDTHVLLWAVGAPQRLPPTLRARLANRTETLVVSAASAFEIATKYRLGKLDSAAPLVRDFPSVVDKLSAVDLPISCRHAIDAGSLQWSHRDPFDRMLVAQAAAESLALVTADPAFAGLPGLTVVWDVGGRP